MERPFISVQLPALYPILYYASLPPAPMFWVADYLAVGYEDVWCDSTEGTQSQAAQIGSQLLGMFEQRLVTVPSFQP